MNCTEIHTGLPQKEVRDFLGMALVKLFETDCKNKKKIVPHIEGGDTLQWVKEDAKEQIRYLEKYVQNVETKQVILKLVADNGWKEHDVSDVVYNDTGYRLKMSFIGRDEEYEVFSMRISKKSSSEN